MIISFSVSSIAGVIISKFGNLNITLVGNVISTIGFFLLFMFHSTEILISINLGDNSYWPIIFKSWVL